MSKLVRTRDLNLQVQVMTAINKLLLEQENALMVSARKQERSTEKTRALPNTLCLPVIVLWHILRQVGS